jgi:hypothetical protein
MYDLLRSLAMVFGHGKRSRLQTRPVKKDKTRVKKV